jgi:predicted RNA polymerase sigma factor
MQYAILCYHDEKVTCTWSKEEDDAVMAKLGSYFYFHGARGAFLQELGHRDEARIAFDRAIALANTPVEAAHIRMRIDRLMKSS